LPPSPATFLAPFSFPISILLFIPFYIFILYIFYLFLNNLVNTVVGSGSERNMVCEECLCLREWHFDTGSAFPLHDTAVHFIHVSFCIQDSRNDRRYSYIEYENGRILGKKGSCEQGLTKVDSWWRWLFWHCSYCFCLCDEQGPKSDRYFNLREVKADVANNK
jgi:hypothetical protein